MNQELTCIGCPVGCRISVELIDGAVTRVTGNTCPRGEKYARQECVAPMRVVTGSMPVSGGRDLRIAVRTSAAIPKEKIFDVMQAIHACTATAPVHIHDVLIANVCGTGADVVAASQA